MKLAHLRLVRAVVESGTLVAAAETLHVSPSALSHQLRELEDHLGAPVFSRADRRWALTQVGERTLAAARAVIAEVETLESHVAELRDGVRGRLAVSTECYTSYHWLPATLKRLRREYPNVEVALDVATTHRPLPGVLAGKLDVAISSDPVADPALEYVELFRDELLAVVSRRHPWAKRAWVEAADFGDVALVVHSLPLSTVTVHRRVLEPAGVSPRELVVLPLTEAAIALVRAELGVTVMAEWAIRPYMQLHDDVVAVRITPEGLHRQQYAARLAADTYPPYHVRFVELLAEEIQV